MKSVVRISVSAVVIAISWAFWPEATDSLTLKSVVADRAATPAKSPSPENPPPQQNIESGHPAQTCPSAEQLAHRCSSYNNNGLA